MISIFVESVPQPKGGLRTQAYVDKHGKMRSRAYYPQTSRQFEKDIKTAITSHFPNITPMAGAVAVSLVFYLERPKSVQRSLPYKRGLDIDKAARATLDAMTGSVYADDSQVCTLFASKVYGSPTGVDITVEQDYDDSDVIYDSCDAFDYRETLI